MAWYNAIISDRPRDYNVTEIQSALESRQGEDYLRAANMHSLSAYCLFSAVPLAKAACLSRARINDFYID